MKSLPFEKRSSFAPAPFGAASFCRLAGGAAALLLLAIFALPAHAQPGTMDGQFVATTNDGTTLVVEVQLRATGGTAADNDMGTSTFILTFNNAALAFQSVTFQRYEGGPFAPDGTAGQPGVTDLINYETDKPGSAPPDAFTMPAANQLSFNIDLLSCTSPAFTPCTPINGVDVPAGFVTFATLTFNVTDTGQLPNLVWNTTQPFNAVGTPYTVGTFTPFNTPLPVEMTSFTGRLEGEEVALTWQTASETNNAGFEVERRALAADGGAWQRLGFVEGRGTTGAPQTYRFEDTALPFGATRLVYRLKQVDFDGAFEYSPEVEVSIDAPQAFQLHGAYPNPFNPQTVIRYELPVGERVRLAVYDALGRQVRTLVDGEQAAGRHEAVFEAGSLASGVYFYRLEAGSRVEIRQMMLLK